MKTKTKHDATNDATTSNDAIDAMRSQKSFTLASLARALSLNEKIVRSRFRKYAKHDDEKYNVVETLRYKNAKTRWVYPNDALDTIVALCKRDDDE